MKNVFLVLIFLLTMLFVTCKNSNKSDNIQNVVVDNPVDEDVEPEVDVAEKLADESESAKKFKQYYKNYRRLNEQSGVKMNNAQLSQLSDDIKESKKQAEFWGSIWGDDLERAIEAAELSGDNKACEQYQQELSKVDEILQRLRNSDDD